MTMLFELETRELPRLLNVTGLLPAVAPNTSEEDLPRIDLSPIKEFNLTLCLAKEWHRFAGHYLVPDGVAVDFVKSEFDGLLPGHFKTFSLENRSSSNWWLRSETSLIPEGMNDLNKEERSRYVS